MTQEETVFDVFSAEIRRGIEDLGWEKPMPVQQRVIPLMREGKDLIVQGQGSDRPGHHG
jgi:superfamily II DNA/RNA helicase